MTQPDTNENKDSKTVDVKEVLRRGERITLRINPELKKAILDWCKQNGLSFCHVVEGLLAGYLYGIREKINLDVKRPTINLTVVRDVKRVRRYSREYGPEPNFYDPHLLDWRYVSDSALNEAGHAVGCGCSVCRGRVSLKELPKE